LLVHTVNKQKGSVPFMAYDMRFFKCLMLKELKQFKRSKELAESMIIEIEKRGLDE
jgi:hypothetical protein